MAGALATAPQMFADLSSVTVRNTFLEFQDIDGDDLLEAGGRARQFSEPVKLNRQLSDQTTAGSGAAAEGDIAEWQSADPEDFNVQAHAKHSEGFLIQPHVQPDMSTHHHASHSGSSVIQPPAQPTSDAAPREIRFCPNCGSRAEPRHRFCPFCRFELRLAAADPSPPVAGTPARLQPPTYQSSQSNSGLPFDLSRFRFIEARPSDVESARAACMSHCMAR